MRILFITSTRIGDAVLASGTLHHLLLAYPQARLTVAAGPLAAPLFEAIPQLERLIVMPKRPYGLHWLALWRQIALVSFDVALDLRGSATTLFVHAASRTIAGRQQWHLHKVEEATRQAGLPGIASPRLWWSKADADEEHAALPQNQPFLALSPAASAPFKEWPPDRFAALANRLTEPGGPLAGQAIVGFGGPGDVEIVQSVLDALERPEDGVNLAGRLALPAVGAALSRARLFVGNDSGLMHMAAAAGAPTLGLFGPTDERVYGPWGRAARSVREGPPVDAAARAALRHADTSLMQQLSLEKVLSAAQALLDDTVQHPIAGRKTPDNSGASHDATV